jgi:CRP-like cAMP-binding protein
MMDNLNSFIKRFIDIDNEELLKITGAFKRRMIRKDEYLLREGEVCKDLVYVKSGCIRMYYLSDKIEVSAWFSLSDSLAMEVQSFISETPTICYLQAIEDSEVFTLSKSQELMRKIWEAALVMVIPRFSSLQNDSAEKRYLDLLNNPELFQQIPQKYLASFIGVTPTSLSRIRKKIR